MKISQIRFDKSAFNSLANLLKVKKKKCYYCNNKITGENIGAFFGNPIKLCCSNMVCLLQLEKSLNEKADV